MAPDHRADDTAGRGPVPARHGRDRPGGVDPSGGPERDRHWPDPGRPARRAVKGRTATPRVTEPASLLARYRFTSRYLASAAIALIATWPL